MKYASTILAFPNHQYDEQLANKFDSIETTAKKLDEDSASKIKVDTMLSLIDLSQYKYQNKSPHYLSIKRDEIQSEITHNIYKASDKNITSFIYGSPKTRESLRYNSELVHAMLELAMKLHDISMKITIYIEPIKHENAVASTYQDVVSITNQLNQKNTNDDITFKPLFDLGNEIAMSSETKYFDTSPIEVATTTDRIHVRSSDPKQTIHHLTNDQISFLKKVILFNYNMTLSYEHINLNENNSMIGFCKTFKQYKTTRDYDVIIIGSGIYGLYCAQQLLNKNLKVAIITKDDLRNGNKESSNVASIVNQARVHNGYHYPRSITTALDSVKHYQRFIDDFKDAIIDNFKQIYAIPRYGSSTSAKQFKQFCDTLGVKCDVYSDDFLRYSQLQDAFLTNEVAIDTSKMIDIALERASSADYYVDTIESIYEYNNQMKIITQSGSKMTANYIINATYSNLNEIIEKVYDNDFDNVENKINMKYQACEIALFKTKNRDIFNRGYTFMDGPFVSIMPHTQDGLISMSSVIYTPHITSYDDIKNLNLKSRKDFMLAEARQFLSDEYLDQLEYVESRYVIKAIQQDVESSDNRLASIYRANKNFASILSGKLNAIYELDEFLNDVYNECILKSENEL